tara:strand:+ start:3574 stop:3867 length:294 start_codon:yes stop_codon:yes gene_type:complete
MATHVTTRGEIPDAPFYITLTDTFMSGWGKARNLTNRLILPCASLDEAARVEQYAKSRKDTKNVRFCTTKPQIGIGQYAQVMDPNNATAWYGREGVK